jgi:hypothetical protein
LVHTPLTFGDANVRIQDILPSVANCTLSFRSTRNHFGDGIPIALEAVRLYGLYSMMMSSSSLRIPDQYAKTWDHDRSCWLDLPVYDAICSSAIFAFDSVPGRQWQPILAMYVCTAIFNRMSWVLSITITFIHIDYSAVSLRFSDPAKTKHSIGNKIWHYTVGRFDQGTPAKQRQNLFGTPFAITSPYWYDL